VKLAKLLARLYVMETIRGSKINCPECETYLEFPSEDLSITDDGEIYEYFYGLCRNCWYATSHHRTIEEAQEEAVQDSFPRCPQCKSNENVKEVKGCKCMSCPPWICMACKPYVNAGHKGYEFFDDDDEEDEPLAEDHG